jgi:hypothetical protein
MPSNELYGYAIRPETRMAFVADLPSDAKMLGALAFFVVAVGLMSWNVLTAAIVCMLALAIGAVASELQLLVIEDAAIVLIRRGLLRQPRARRVPFAGVKLVERGNQYQSGHLWLRTRSGDIHGLSFVMKGRRPRFITVMTFGRHRFPVDPRRAPVEAAGCLCEILSAAGLVVEGRAVSRFEHINNLGFWNRKRP